MKKPLQPLWVSPETSSEQFLEFAEFHPIICCTASRRVEGAEVSGNGYIQGAGDDNEAWSCGLTPPLFWQHRQQLMSTDEEELPKLIQSLLKSEDVKSKNNAAVLVAPTKNIYIGTLNLGPPENIDGMILCIGQVTKMNFEDVEKSGHVLCLECGTGKTGSRALRARLPLVREFVSSLTKRHCAPKIFIACSTGIDLSVGIALTILCLYFDDNCKL